MAATHSPGMLFSLLMIATAAVGPDLRPVMVDWSGVSESAVQRCNLALLQTLLLQGMVESGFAVVDTLGPRVIKVTLRERKGAFLVDAQRDDVVAKRRVPIPNRCDSTIAVDLQAAARATALEVEEQTPTPPPTSNAPVAPFWADRPPPVVEDVRVQAAPVSTSARAWTGPRGRVGLGASMSSSGSPFAALTAQIGARYGGWWLAASLDAAVRDSLGVIVLEPALGPELSRLVSVGNVQLGIGLSAQLLSHRYWRDDGGGGHFDARFSAPLRVEHATSGVGLALVPSVRMRPVEHRIGDELAYKARLLGFLAAITFRIPP